MARVVSKVGGVGKDLRGEAGIVSSRRGREKGSKWRPGVGRGWKGESEGRPGGEMVESKHGRGK